MLSKSEAEGRDNWRSNLRKQTFPELIDHFGERLMNSIDVGGRRGQVSTETEIAIDTSSELNFDHLMLVSRLITYFAEQVILADVSLTRHVTVRDDGSFKIVTLSMVAHHVEKGKMLKDSNLTEIRSLLNHYRRRRREKEQSAA